MTAEVPDPLVRYIVFLSRGSGITESASISTLFLTGKRAPQKGEWVFLYVRAPAGWARGSPVLSHRRLHTTKG